MSYTDKYCLDQIDSGKDKWGANSFDDDDENTPLKQSDIFIYPDSYYQGIYLMVSFF